MLSTTASRVGIGSKRRSTGNCPSDLRIHDLKSPRRNLLSGILAHCAHFLSSDDERERAQRNALLAFSVRCASAALLYLSQIVLAQWMGSNEYGIYVFVWTWVLILGGLSHLGLNLATIRLVPTYREGGNLPLLRGLIRGSRLIAVGAGTAVMILGLLGLRLASAYIDNQYVLPFYLALICVPLFALTDVQDGIGRGNGWMAPALMPPYVLRPLLVLMAMTMAKFAGFEMSATTAAGAAIVATWTSALVQALMIDRRMSASIPAGPRTHDLNGWLSISLPSAVILACELVLQNADVLIISHYMSPTDVGIYFAAGKTMALIMFVHYAVGSAVAGRFAALGARGDRESLKAFVGDSVNWTFWPSLAGAILILAMGKPLLALFGAQFESGYPVMCILVAGFLFRSAMGPAEFLLNMLGEQKVCAGVLLTSALTSIILNLLLVPRFGLTGAATATAMALIAAAFLNYLAIWRRLDIEIAIWKNLAGL